MTGPSPIPSAAVIRANLAAAERDGIEDAIGQIVDAVRHARDTAECWGAGLDGEHNERLVAEIQVCLHNALQLAERMR